MPVLIGVLLLGLLCFTFRKSIWGKREAPPPKLKILSYMEGKYEWEAKHLVLCEGCKLTWQDRVYATLWTSCPRCGVDAPGEQLLARFRGHLKEQP